MLLEEEVVVSDAEQQERSVAASDGLLVPVGQLVSVVQVVYIVQAEEKPEPEAQERSAHSASESSVAVVEPA